MLVRNELADILKPGRGPRLEGGGDPANRFFDLINTIGGYVGDETVSAAAPEHFDAHHVCGGTNGEYPDIFIAAQIAPAPHPFLAFEPHPPPSPAVLLPHAPRICRPTLYP